MLLLLLISPHHFLLLLFACHRALLSFSTLSIHDHTFHSCVSVDDEQFFLFPFPLPFFLLFARCHQRLHPSSDDDIVGLARQPPPHQTRITLSSLPAAAKNIAFFLSFALCLLSFSHFCLHHQQRQQPTNQHYKRSTATAFLLCCLSSNTQQLASSIPPPPTNQPFSTCYPTKNYIDIYILLLATLLHLFLKKKIFFLQQRQGFLVGIYRE